MRFSHWLNQRELLCLASPRLRIQNWFLTLLNSACLISVGIARIVFSAHLETSAPHTLCCVGRVTGFEAPARCKSNMLGIQRKKRCYWVCERGDEVLWEVFVSKGGIWQEGWSSLGGERFGCIGWFSSGSRGRVNGMFRVCQEIVSDKSAGEWYIVPHVSWATRQNARPRRLNFLFLPARSH